ncbi:type VI secretion system-associated protein TagO [Psychromarinibacter sp. C21-152]|uniref:Type VI secretion system-associated protein TagO n=1 Tax=Psychromarinibacter sediminicola TaxID=3033385 RepID=A0AAE3NQW4_9RHOB|nr:type VI secretion system-associated protein TagO [Psychromarinibacter sediminicola]MDF0602583.1 type VI secretion system-associated protein TagO [Psychromarinibacter sediminicola]
MMRAVGIVAAIGMLGAPAFALDDCVEIENDLDRLACYDRAAGRTPVTEVDQDAGGDWMVRTETSEFTDTTNVYLTVESEEPLRCNMFGTPQHANLILRCLEDTTSLFIATDCHLTSGHGGYGQVEYRIDDRPAVSKGFDASTSNNSLGLWNGGRSIPLVKELLGAERLLVRFTPFNESPATARFDITGLEQAIAPLREACHW